MLWRQRHLFVRHWTARHPAMMVRFFPSTTDEIPELNQPSKPDRYDFLGDTNSDDDYLYDEAGETNLLSSSSRKRQDDGNSANPYDDPQDPSLLTSLEEAAWEENIHQEAWENEDEWDGDEISP